ncbi:right-handed parallel beta-helix repeat-containing protein [Curtobacterium ammoniigenes]|uniref:right-handed parallel beta-helix repeat-containing protein n=1 Tax=Curtobacterium ammoniigenes TaxID=395387 RepID=UPI000AAAB88C|nr:right-handed parallel beta-helix repeat-containing protein [Curtobacterium ammoniigenes]
MAHAISTVRTPLIAAIAGLVIGGLVVSSVWLAVALRGPGGGHHPVAAPVDRPTATATPSPSTAGGAALAGPTPAACAHPTATVTTAKALEKALAAVHAGSVIAIASGTYSGKFVGSGSGTAQNPIALCGASGVVLDGGGVHSGYALHIQDGSNWVVYGVHVQNAQKGIVFDTVSHSLIDSVTVTDIGDEGIHLRKGSTYDTISHSSVSGTGTYKPQFGEGIYVGSSKNNWCSLTNCQPDRSDHNLITGNTIFDTGAENIDIKEGTTAGTISDNSLNGTGMQGKNSATSWVNVKGNNWTITGNHGVHSIKDGFSTHQLLNGWGTDNTFSDNTVQLDNSTGVAFALRPVLGNVVDCNNTVIGSNELSTTKCTG